MTHYIPDSPRLGRSWCPGCDPNLDPTREILETSYCPTHKPHHPSVAAVLACSRCSRTLYEALERLARLDREERTTP